MLSLTARLLLAASTVLVAFLGVTGAALDGAFRDSAEAAVRDRLQAQIYLLLGAAELGDDGVMTLPNALPEARFSSPASGLYASVVDTEGRALWRSGSLLGFEIPFPRVERPGEALFQRVQATDGAALFALSFAVSWENAPARARHFEFRVAETTSGFNAEISRFRRSLWGWLLAGAVALLAFQGAILRWSLAPLRQVAREVREIEAGTRELFTERYPRELRPLTRNLNALVRHSRTHLERYRNALGDLAHSLKTPLAVLSGVSERNAEPDELRATLAEQVARMNRSVDYQLQRAAVAGRSVLASPVAVGSEVDRIVASLRKVYAAKHIDFEVDIAPELVFDGDAGDLAEVVGNLLDNACKWCRARVSISAVAVAADDDVGARRLLLYVEDDGDGIPHDKAQLVLERGARVDEQAEGQGIGLAVVRDIVERVYGGALVVRRAELGGARVELTL